jgi:hypothetical protein
MFSKEILLKARLAKRPARMNLSCCRSNGSVPNAFRINSANEDD